MVVHITGGGHFEFKIQDSRFKMILFQALGPYIHEIT